DYHCQVFDSSDVLF
nr:immunoglobulin light chain junction region [Macaca mulatta]MOV66936.1 immunoglobulin light chain junction region [Macaca mulatta]MOV67695.1 immunoglobulin light chain junction region [Macaca mulatta]MOV68159.1 immunoglobulin light chain junction region [Macaca mulatta]MOV68205.1 immunoglobulin light chain junction region [Macaca mulatta]